MTLINKLKNFLKTAKNPLIVILGPTASGKTSLSVKIAKEIDGEILSTDSRQIYKEMEIGTATVTKEEMQGVPHHMLGISKPDKTLNLAEYTQIALKEIDQIYARKHVPILAGGTGLYMSAIMEGYDVPKVPPNEKLRKMFYKEADEKGPSYIHDKLKKLDPQAAKSIHPNNLRYVIRALEINQSTGLNKNDAKARKSRFSSFLIGIDWPRDQLYKRINKRVDIQAENGLIDEVKELLKKGYDENLPSMSSLGVKEIIPYIKGKMPLEECLDVLRQGTRNYAKRQMTWFRRYNNVHWLSPSELEEIINS